MAFYVSFSSAAGKSRIHLSSCPHCRDGAVDCDAHMAISWSPTLNTLSAAESYAMRMFPHFRDRGKCDRCMSGEFIGGPFWLVALKDWIGGFSKPSVKALQHRK
jgi:hypothetical protein